MALSILALPACCFIQRQVITILHVERLWRALLHRDGVTMCWKMLHAEVHKAIPGSVLTCVLGKEKSGADATRSTESRLKTLSGSCQLP